MQETRRELAKESYLSEVASIIINIFVGLCLTLLILPRQSFGQIVLMVPAMISTRGNISGSFSARTARDLVIGSFRQNHHENILSTVVLTIVTSEVIGGLSLCIALLLKPGSLLPVHCFLLLPLITMLLTVVVSIPISTGLNTIAFKKGLNPSNVVPPIMTSVDDILVVVNMFIALVILGVP
ncbi:MAG: magnesium transporter [Candidatus Sigynarchaeota archaeon]